MEWSGVEWSGWVLAQRLGTEPSAQALASLRSLGDSLYLGARSSAVEHSAHNRACAGSNPAGPIPPYPWPFFLGHFGGGDAAAGPAVLAGRPAGLISHRGPGLFRRSQGAIRQRRAEWPGHRAQGTGHRHQSPGLQPLSALATRPGSFNRPGSASRAPRRWATCSRFLWFANHTGLGMMRQGKVMTVFCG